MSTAAATLSESNGFEFHPSLTEDERRFYTKAYPSVDLVRERKVHCTVCKMHIGTAPSQEDNIKMHPILRVTHCIKCHDFYNSGEFSKGEDGSELYCRWCGQGGEVYCCSNCPYVFCKSCIVKNLSRGVVADIEQNENWSCFSCAPKILWPLRAQHWALVNYIEKQKQSIQSMNFTEDDLKQEMNKDRSNCCRLAKSKCGNMSDSLESLDSTASRRSFGSNSTKKPIKVPYHPMQSPPAKRAKTSNDEVVCTPDLMSMLEPDCQITIPNKSRAGPPIAVSTPKVISIQPNFGTIPTPAAHKSTVPPPLVLRNTGIQMRPIQTSPIVRRTVVGPRPPTPGGGHTPVYHTINGFRIDLNSAAQQETFRLPNGKLIQVKRQGTQQNIGTPNNSWQQRNVPNPQPQSIRPLQISHSAPPSNFHTVTLQQPAANGQALPHPHQQIVRYQNTVLGSTTVTPINHNGTQIQLINGTPTAPVQQTPQSFRPLMVRHIFPDTAIGQARSQLQDQVFCAMDICQHLTGKVQTLTNSNAYKQARNYLEVKELYIHLSYLLTYAIGRFKGLQDKCLADMRQLGFVNDADSLENGQLAADKQASDDEDNEIEIVEPPTDTITLDSDNEDEANQLNNNKTSTQQAPAVYNDAICSTSTDIDLITTTQTLLSSLLDVDLSEPDRVTSKSLSNDIDTMNKKQPRKKTTHKPNPTLIKQKEMRERQRLEEIKRNDIKLKMKCTVPLKKAEEEYPFAKHMLYNNVLETSKTLVDHENSIRLSEVSKSTDEVIQPSFLGNESEDECILIENTVENNELEKCSQNLYSKNNFELMDTCKYEHLGITRSSQDNPLNTETDSYSNSNIGILVKAPDPDDFVGNDIEDLLKNRQVLVQEIIQSNPAHENDFNISEVINPVEKTNFNDK